MNGYYTQPNCNIPLNAREIGEVAPVAYEQLKPYQDAAESWDIYQDQHGYYRCGLDDQAIWRELDDHGQSYQWTQDEIKALIVAHIRQRHSGRIDEPVQKTS